MKQHFPTYSCGSGELTTLPVHAARLLAIADDDASALEQLIVIVSRDPPLSTRVLRRVNSAYYGVPNQISEIPMAINLLGVREMRNIALTAAVSQLFACVDTTASAHGYNREELWLYSVASARSAALIAEQSGVVSPPTAYATGLLHDIGYFMIEQHLRSHYLRFVALARHRASESFRVTDLEEEVFSFNHASLGGYAAKRWNLPRAICDGIEFHHHLECYTGEHRALVAVVALANHLCGELGLTSLGIESASPNMGAVLAASGVSTDDLEILRPKIANAAKGVDAPTPIR